MTSQPFTHFADALTYIMAGNSKFTIRSIATGKRFTYTVVKSDGDHPLYFVKVLTGPANTEDYTYIGVIRDNGFATTAKSKFADDAPCVKAFAWALNNLRCCALRAGVMEIWHEGSCGRCNRVLTVPSSVKLGIGPDCARIMCVAA